MRASDLWFDEERLHGEVDVRTTGAEVEAEHDKSARLALEVYIQPDPGADRARRKP